MNSIAIFLAEDLVYLVGLVIPYLWWRRERHDLIRILVTVVAAFAVSEVLKSFFAIPRPFVAEGFTPLVKVSPRDFYGSFPSGHVTFLAALGSAIFFTEKLPGVLVLLGGVLVGLGRILVGVHYPLDILGGFAIGVVVAGFFKALHEVFPVW